MRDVKKLKKMLNTASAVGFQKLLTEKNSKKGEFPKNFIDLFLLLNGEVGELGEEIVAFRDLEKANLSSESTKIILENIKWEAADVLNYASAIISLCEELTSL